MTRAMEQVGAGLEKIVAGSLRRSPAGEGPLLAWALACGQAVAARTRAVDFARIEFVIVDKTAGEGARVTRA